MIKSMTGFASLTREDDLATISVTVRSVNHRYLDLQLRVPPALADLEARLRAAVQQRVARGRVELAVSLQWRQPPALEVQLNEQFVEGLATALQGARERGLVSGTLGPSDLVRLPQALTIRERSEGEDPVRQAVLFDAVEHAVREALDGLEAMRTREGAFLRADLDARGAALAALVERITGAEAEGRADLQERLTQRLAGLAADLQADPVILAQEVVRFVARSDISEEIVRFRGHLAHWQALSDAFEPCGRKLDFLLQEMNREVNTIGAKAEGTVVPELIVTAKAELEKMREQVQNVE